MFVALFAVSFVLALAVSATVAWLFAKPMDGILHRFAGDNISATWSRYLRFAVVVVGISAGTRARALEEYIAAPSWNKAALTAALTQEFWVLELYRTIVATLQGIAWLFLVLSFFTIIAFLVVRKTKSKHLQRGEEQPQLPNAKSRVSTIR